MRCTIGMEDLWLYVVARLVMCQSHDYKDTDL